MVESKKIKILLVDDENLIRSLFSDAFQVYGGEDKYEIKTLSGVENFEKEVLSYRPDIILLDLIMPLKNTNGTEQLSEEAGFSLLKELKTNPETKNISVIVFSNLGDIMAKEKAESFGADAYMVKSETLPEDLIKAIEDTLKKKSGK